MILVYLWYVRDYMESYDILEVAEQDFIRQICELSEDPTDTRGFNIFLDWIEIEAEKDARSIYLYLINSLEENKGRIDPLVYTVMRTRLLLRVNDGNPLFDNPYKNREFLKIVKLVENADEKLILMTEQFIDSDVDLYRKLDALYWILIVVESEIESIAGQQDVSSMIKGFQLMVYALMLYEILRSRLELSFVGRSDSTVKN